MASDPAGVYGTVRALATKTGYQTRMDALRQAQGLPTIMDGRKYGDISNIRFTRPKMTYLFNPKKPPTSGNVVKLIQFGRSGLILLIEKTKYAAMKAGQGGAEVMGE